MPKGVADGARGAFPSRSLQQAGWREVQLSDRQSVRIGFRAGHCASRYPVNGRIRAIFSSLPRGAANRPRCFRLPGTGFPGGDADADPGCRPICHSHDGIRVWPHAKTSLRVNPCRRLLHGIITASLRSEW